MFCFFFKQKTASELRISDWSSDVCSSDLVRATPEDMAQGRAPVGSQVLPYPDDPRGLGMIAVERRAVVGGDQLIDASVGQDQYGAPAVNFRRSEERRVGKECARPCKPRWSSSP